MKKRVIQSILAVLLVFGLFNIPAFQAVAQGTDMYVISEDLPVYSSPEDLSNFGNPTQVDLSYNEKVTVLSEKGYAAEIKMADGTVGCVDKAYLNSNIMNQTWLVKEWRNIHTDPNSNSPLVRSVPVPNNSIVHVLAYNKDTKYYQIRLDDGTTGWIKGTYLKDQQYDYGSGRNIIPYDSVNTGTVTNNLSIFTPLNTMANVNADLINKFIDYKTNGAKTLMTGMGAAYLQAQAQSSLNAIYLLAHSGLESKWGISDIVTAKNNFYGIKANDSDPMSSAAKFSTPVNGIIEGAIYISDNYVNRDKTTGVDYPFAQPTLDNMRFNDNLHQYSTDEAWASKIASIIQEFNDFTYTKGWQNIAGKKYYNNGDGTYKTGWQAIGGKWYYFNGSGLMQTGWLSSGGKWYYLNSGGIMQTGWLSSGSNWYYLNSSGVMQTGWQSISHNWYYFYSDGHMAANTRIGKYRLGKSGAMI